MNYREDLSGNTYGRLLVTAFNKDKSVTRSHWDCKCSCGKTTVVEGSKLKNSHTSSCGCLARGLHTTHGMSRTPTYVSYSRMIERCTYKGHPAYNYYGGAGISVCARWMESPRNFLEDMGERLDGTSLDRIDGTKGYYKENCRWATDEEQSRNRSSNKLDEYKVGILRSLTRWGLSSKAVGRVLGCHRRTVEDVLNNKTWKGVAA